MADNFKVLYQGQIGNSAATLATVPTGVKWVIKLMTCVNTDTSTRTFGLLVGGTAATNQVTSQTISLPASGGYWEWNPSGMTLESAQTIAGIASVATKLTLTVWGDEVS